MKKLFMLAFVALTLAATPIHVRQNPFPDCNPCPSVR